MSNAPSPMAARSHGGPPPKTFAWGETTWLRRQLGDGLDGAQRVAGAAGLVRQRAVVPLQGLQVGAALRRRRGVEDAVAAHGPHRAVAVGRASGVQRVPAAGGACAVEEGAGR